MRIFLFFILSILLWSCTTVEVTKEVILCEYDRRKWQATEDRIQPGEKSILQLEIGWIWKTVGSLVVLSRQGVTGHYSRALSRHCARWTIFLALLPAWGVVRFLSNQDTPAYAREPLSHTRSARTLYQRIFQDITSGTTIHQPSPHSGDRRAWNLPADSESQNGTVM